MRLIKQGGDDWGLGSRIFGINFGPSPDTSNILPIYQSLNIDPGQCRVQPFKISSLTPRVSSARDLVCADMGAIFFDSAGITSLSKADDAMQILRRTQSVLPNHIGGGWNSGQWWLVANMGLVSWMKAVFVPAVVNGEILVFLTQNEPHPSLIILLQKEAGNLEPMVRRHFENSMTGIPA